MLQRCFNPKNHKYKDYGAKGIRVCLRWQTYWNEGSFNDGYTNFLEDMGPRPEGLTLGRKDHSKGYSPDNCFWQVAEENSGNRG